MAKIGKYTKGKIEFYVPSYNFMRRSSNGNINGTIRTESKTLYYDVLDSKGLEEGKRYKFEKVSDTQVKVKLKK